MKQIDGDEVAVVMLILAFLCMGLAAYFSMRDVRRVDFVDVIATQPDLSR